MAEQQKSVLQILIENTTRNLTEAFASATFSDEEKIKLAQAVNRAITEATPIEIFCGNDPEWTRPRDPIFCGNDPEWTRPRGPTRKFN